jgi:hypothetical protein
MAIKHINCHAGLGDCVVIVESAIEAVMPANPGSGSGTGADIQTSSP